MIAETDDILTLDVTSHEDHTVVALSGELDLASQGDLRTCLNDLIVAGHVHLVLDLSQCAFVDSTGLGALIGARRRVHAFQGSLTLVCPTDAVMKVFTITGLEKVFDIRDSMESALAG